MIKTAWKKEAQEGNRPVWGFTSKEDFHAWLKQLEEE
jgi:hypothetical protein